MLFPSRLRAPVRVVVVGASSSAFVVLSLLVCLLPSASIVIVVAVLAMPSCRFSKSQPVLPRILDRAWLWGFGSSVFGSPRLYASLRSDPYLHSHITSALSVLPPYLARGVCALRVASFVNRLRRSVHLTALESRWLS